MSDQELVARVREVGSKPNGRWAVAVATPHTRAAELGPIPDREFTDQWGHHWEWCGGVTGTWAWRITKLEGRRL